jgi:hypothetical protein
MPKQMVTLLRKIEVEIVNGYHAQSREEAEITAQS